MYVFLRVGQTTLDPFATKPPSLLLVDGQVVAPGIDQVAAPGSFLSGDIGKLQGNQESEEAKKLQGMAGTTCLNNLVWLLDCLLAWFVSVRKE